MALQDSIQQLQNFDLSDLDFNNVGTWPAAVKGIVMALLLALVLGAGYYFHLTEKRTSLDRVRMEENTLRSEFEDKSQQVANLDVYRQQKVEMEETFGTLLRQLPSDTEVPGLIEDITRAALENELKIESITLQAERPSQFYVELPIDISVEGNYHRLGQFVSAVANLSRIVTLHDFTIAPMQRGEGLGMTIQAKTYRYLEEEQ
jgi:type IV pilus assembly protein PilO